MTEEKDFSGWIGRTDTPSSDIITPRLEASFEATLSPYLAESEDIAPGLHWCLAPQIAAQAELGPDGHPAKGKFLPPVPLPRRMWAGGFLEFIDPLRIGDIVKKYSTIKDITWKTGSTGRLCFVIVEHVYTTDRGTAIRESHNIVYRAAATGPAPIPMANAAGKTFDLSWQVPISTVTLFRFSALTFNGHRIHYDQPYATGTEFYPDLVIHAPLQATLLLNIATVIKGRLPRRFGFRSLAPATGVQTLHAGATIENGKAALSIVSETGVETMTGIAE